MTLAAGSQRLENIAFVGENPDDDFLEGFVANALCQGRKPSLKLWVVNPYRHADKTLHTLSP